MKDLFGKDLSSLKDKKLFLFDLDGTIYLENRVFDGTLRLLNAIKKRGDKYVFITNNSSKSCKGYIKKLKKMGIACGKENFFTSTMATEILLKEKFGDNKIFVQGTRAFIKELKKYGVKLTTKYDKDVSAILVGFDTELTAKKMRITSKMLTEVKVPYYATNPDWVCPVSFGYVPDCGSMCFGYEKATGRTPEFIGKPSPTIIDLAIKKANADKSFTVVIGDRIYTDIASGINAGVDTVLVLSGETKKEDCLSSEIKPAYVINGVEDIPY